MSGEDIDIVCADGYRLRASLYAAQGERTLIINSAMGVHRHFYRGLARFLNERGYRVITYDYRGIADSAPASLRDCEARLHEWGELDLDAVLRHAREAYPTARLAVLGHSVGVQIIGLAPANHCIDALVAVATQSGYWKHWRGLGRLGMFALWHFVLPAVTRIAGRFPGRFAGASVSLPKHVALDWARYGRDPDYLRGRHKRASDRYFATLRAPILALSIADDGYAPRAATEALLAWYENAPHELRVIAPHDLGVEKIGHFGWFRQRIGASSWAEVCGWLDPALG